MERYKEDGRPKVRITLTIKITNCDCPLMMALAVIKGETSGMSSSYRLTRSNFFTRRNSQRKCTTTGFLTFCIGTQPDLESSTSISISASTITRKVTSKSVSKPQAEVSTKEELPVTEQTPSALYNSDKPSYLSREENNVTKPQKPKKKILVSNLKNISEKVVLLDDRHERENLLKSVINVTEGTEFRSGGTKNFSDSTEDEGVEDSSSPKSVNETVAISTTNRTSSTNSDGKESSGPIEGRSLEDRSSEENVNFNPNEKIKVLTNSTEKSSGNHEQITLPGPQKMISNIRSRTESSSKPPMTIQPTHSVVLSTKKSTPVSVDNTLKNSVRFENDYYGSDGQTDWVPFTPDILPVRSSATSQQSGNKFKLVAGLTNNSMTDERNATRGWVFPTENPKTQKETNIILMKEEAEKTTVRLKNSAEKPIRIPNSTESGRVSSAQPIKHPLKFRGAIRYKSSQSNSSTDEKISHVDHTTYKNNFSLEVPVTKSYNSSEKPEETTEISVVTVLSSTNHTIKSQNAVDSHLVVPPENVRVNITKEQQGSTNYIPDALREDAVQPSGNLNASQIENDLPKVIGDWIPVKKLEDVKVRNETDVVIPSSVNIKNLNSTRTQETKKSVVPTENIKTNRTTENVDATNNILKLDISNSTTKKSILEEVSRRSNISSNNAYKLFEVEPTRNQTKSAKKEEVKASPTEPTLSPVTGTTDFLTTLQSKEFEETTSETTEKPPQAIENSTATGPVVTSVASNPNDAVQFMNINVTTVKPFDVVEMKKVSTYDRNMNVSTVPTSPSEEISNITESSITYITTVNLTVPPSTTTDRTNSELTSTEREEKSKSTMTPGSWSTHSPTNLTVLPSIRTVDVTTLKPKEKSHGVKTSTTTEAITRSPPVAVASTTTTTATTIALMPTTPSITFSTIPAPSTTIESPKTVKNVTETTTVTSNPSSTIHESTEEGIYYKNYVPTTGHPHDGITEENVPAYLRLTVQAASWEELCRLKEDLRESIIKMLGGKNVSAEAVHFLNLNDRNCLEKIEESKREPANGTVFLPVNMFLMDQNGDFDKNLSEVFLTLWGRKGLDFELPIRKVDFVTPIANLTEIAESPLGGSVVAAIVISCVAGICVILLGILFVIMKRRQKRFNYGQRCTPVSLDAYSLDSVSIYNSVRRKGMRASKRSYGNAAFDDPEVPTHPMNFAGLANFSSDKEQLYEEFNIIPQVYPKVEELPEGAETKNRYSNVIPLPETRVHLTIKDGDPLSDYINANYVRGLKGGEKLYIACQAPLESTIEDFWRMVWEQQCKVILMLTDLQENGIEKCADYLPPNEVTDNLRLFGDFQVTLKKRDVKEKYIISNLKLKNMEANLWREVTHLWYLGWPDQGVPSEANSLIAFLIEARSQMKIQNGVTSSSPAVVHCSPGTGRTGTVIACDLCIRDYEQNRMVDIPKCVFNLRRDRAGSVQTKDQYAFIYQVLNVYATKLSGGGIESI